MATDMPRRAAMYTTENLENILTFLPPRTLFGVQRVSRQWKDLIARSLPIQEKMFLRCKATAPEVWMLINPRPTPDNLEWKFRTVSATEVESSSWRKDSGGIQRLFTPVTLNPWLDKKIHPGSHWNEGVYHIDARLTPAAKFAYHNSLRHTYIIDPPLVHCMAMMTFIIRGNNCHLLMEFEVVGSDKPLTLGNVMDRVLASKQWHLENLRGEVPEIRNTGANTLAEKILELEKQQGQAVELCMHDCNIRLEQPTVAHGGSAIRPLVLADDEYLLYKPGGNVPQ